MKELDKSKFWIIRDNPIIKTGVFPYLGRQISPDLNPTQIYNVLRPEDELFKQKTIDSFNMLPITIGHALLGSKDEGLTPPEEKGIEGTTGEHAKRTGDKMTNTIKLYSERIKDEINNGKKELSAGYFCDFMPESGTYQGRHYDYVQRNIDGNHIALVEKGRNGSDVRVMDSAEGLDKHTRQFVCDAMELGKIEEQGEDMNGNSAKDANWEEGKHKRDSDGKFSSGNGGGGAKEDKAASPKELSFEQLKDRFGDNLSLVLKSAKKGNIYSHEEIESFFKKADKMKDELGRLKVDQFKRDFNEADQKEYARKEDEMKKYGDNVKERYLNAPSNVWEDYVKAHNKYFASDLSSKNHGNGGQDAATGKENETMDKREIIREIMAVAAKPADQFQGGEEEREKTIAELAEKIAYNPSESDANDTDADPKEQDPKPAEKDAEDKGAGCDADEADKTEKDEEDKKPASLDEMEKELLARIGRKAELVSKLTPIIGAFDSASMTEKEVAAYACKKLNIKAAMDEAPAVLKGYLAGYKPAEKRVTMKSAQDEAVNTDVLNDFKEGK